MVLRNMKEADAAALHAIHGACLTSNLLGRSYTRQQIAAWMAGRTPGGYVKASRNGEHFLVAVLGGEVVGFASWQDDELLSLFVHPDRQGRSIGSTLASACFTRAARGGEPVKLVRSAIGAEPFYQRYNFETVGSGTVTKRGVEIPHTVMERAA